VPLEERRLEVGVLVVLPRLVRGRRVVHRAQEARQLAVLADGKLGVGGLVLVPAVELAEDVVDEAACAKGFEREVSVAPE